MAEHAINIVIGGEAGQGLVTLGQILGKVLIRGGYHIVVTQTYMSRVRGGHNTFAVRVSPHEIAAPQESINLLVALNKETVDLHRGELGTPGLVMADAAYKLKGDGTLSVPFGDLSSERYVNTVALGVIGEILGLGRDRVSTTVEEVFGGSGSAVGTANQEALEAGFRWGGDNARGRLQLPPVQDAPRRMMMDGNEAIALGAVAGGLKFSSFYPLTPSTSIGQNLATWSGDLGLVVEQGEDEIAVVNMALGASFAGAPSMVGTSGGGFALMVEGVSLAAMTETPLVVVVGQRPGPATGLPTRTEQGDLEFVLHAGHGEFSRAVYAPANPQQCFELTQRALYTADRYQSPVFILTDQFLADSHRAVVPFSLDNRSPVRPWFTEDLEVATPYRRFALTEAGISPRLLPGMSKHLMVVDSDEHYEDGHITEDLGMRTRMVEKRLKKASGIHAEVIPPEWIGDDAPDLLLICWGCSPFDGGFIPIAVRRAASGRAEG